MDAYDAILVPGGGVREGGELPLWVKRRFDRVIEIYKNEYVITLSAGTLLKPPPLDDRGFTIFESVAGAQYLIKNGIPPKKILVETCSYDTIGNAYFARVIHVDPRGFIKLLVITSEFHMPRTERIFRWVFGLSPISSSYELSFEAVSDVGMDEKALKTRKLAEKANIARLTITKSRIHTLEELHKWLFTKHDAYAMAAKSPKYNVSQNLLKTY
jgi:hypothetical protein